MLETQKDYRKCLPCTWSYVRHDTSLSTRTLARKLENIGVEVSYRTIGRHLSSIGYVKRLPKATPILTETHKKHR
ncbi:unnamed protein product [Rhizophagus irregularis]|uniref:Transposase Tc1-like domain-containing protein n=1 Tax=Rhizophagus irregularis TaxID=588596 RepID=A0A915ZDI1_9GLOM|nr:unnamed protein product [Rhizophagus irregularis]CAB5370727.1 unnamed protein product [Rhizophagus irregularis]